MRAPARGLQGVLGVPAREQRGRARRPPGTALLAAQRAVAPAERRARAVVREEDEDRARPVAARAQLADERADVVVRLVHHAAQLLPVAVRRRRLAPAALDPPVVDLQRRVHRLQREVHKVRRGRIGRIGVCVARAIGAERVDRAARVQLGRVQVVVPAGLDRRERRAARRGVARGRLREARVACRERRVRARLDEVAPLELARRGARPRRWPHAGLGAAGGARLVPPRGRFPRSSGSRAPTGRGLAVVAEVPFACGTGGGRGSIRIE